MIFLQDIEGGSYITLPRNRKLLNEGMTSEARLRKIRKSICEIEGISDRKYARRMHTKRRFIKLIETGQDKIGEKDLYKVEKYLEYLRDYIIRMDCKAKILDHLTNYEIVRDLFTSC